MEVLKTKKPKLLYRLVDAAAEKVYRSAAVLGPVVAGAIASARHNSEASDLVGQFAEFPSVEDVTHLNWDATYGHTTKR